MTTHAIHSSVVSRLARRIHDNPRRRLLETLLQNAEWVDEADNAPTVQSITESLARELDGEAGDDAMR